MKDLIEALNRAHELDNPRNLREAAPRTIDTTGLQKNLPVVVKELLSQLPYKLEYQKLTGKIEKNDRPVSYTFRGTVHVIKDDSVQDTWQFRNKDGVTRIDLDLYNLPTNCELTAELLKTTYEKTILKAITYCFTSSDDFESRGALYESLEQKLKDAVKPLETKYRVTLNAYFYPKKDEFQRQGGSLTTYVKITSVEGKSGQLQKQDSGYYEYEVDGKNYSSFLGFRDHSVSSHNRALAEKIDIDLIVRETEQRIVELLSRIDELDNILNNESAAEKNMADFITNLARKYPDTELTVAREDTWYDPSPFIVSYDNGSDSWELSISLSEVVDSFEKVKKRIQQKIYRTGKTKPQPSFAHTSTDLNFESYDVSEALNRAHELDEAAFNRGVAGDNSYRGGTIRGRGASTQPGKNNYLNRMKSKNPDLVDTMVIKVSDIKPGMITQAGQVKEAEARNHVSGGKKMYIMHSNGYDGFWGLDETMDVMVDPENKSKPFSGDYRALLKMGLKESTSLVKEDYDYRNSWATDVFSDDTDNNLITKFGETAHDNMGVPVCCDWSSWNMPETVTNAFQGKIVKLTPENFDNFMSMLCNAYEAWKLTEDSKEKCKYYQSYPDFDLANDWYNDSGSAAEDGWPDTPLGDDPEYAQSVMSWWDDNSWKYVDDEDYDESLTEALAKEKPVRSTGYAYTIKDIKSNINKILKETNKHEQRRQLKDLTSGCRLTMKDVDDLVKRLTTYSDALHTFVDSSRTDTDAQKLLDSIKDLSV